MSEPPLRAPRIPEDFAEILSGAELPLIVGGQAVNIWARLYGSKIPTLRAYRPFVSVDADIYGTRELAQTLAHRTGWEISFPRERDSMVAAFLKRPATSGAKELSVEVLHEVNGLSAEDLARDVVVGSAHFRYRIPSPLVMLKAKLYNLISLVATPRPQDLRHVKMLIPIVRQYLNESFAAARAGEMTKGNFQALLRYAGEVVNSSASQNAAHAFQLDLRPMIPRSLLHASAEIRDSLQPLLVGIENSSPRQGQARPSGEPTVQTRAAGKVSRRLRSSI